MAFKAGSVIVFEPWGLGDVAIALGTTRRLKDQGWRTAIVCHPEWTEWAAASGFVDTAIGFHAPWTDRKDKYRLRKYRVADFSGLRGRLAHLKPDAICEMRGDLRNLLLLGAMRTAPVHSLFGRSFASRYDRPRTLLSILDAETNEPSDAGHSPRERQIGAPARIIASFDAAWANRAVPTSVADSIALSLQQLGCDVRIVTDPRHGGSGHSRQPTGIPVISGPLDLVCSELLKADAFLGTDSGLLHVAHLLGLRCFGMFGFATDSEWAPPGCTVIHPPTVYPAAARYLHSGEGLMPLASLNPGLVALSVSAALQSPGTSQ